MDIRTMCRCCLSRKGQLEIKNNLKNMMEFCLDIQVLNSDSTTVSFLCKKCYHLVLQFCAFKRDVQRKDRLLRKKKNSQSKRQDTVVMIALNQAHIHDDEGSNAKIEYESNSMKTSEEESRKQGYESNVLNSGIAYDTNLQSYNTEAPCLVPLTESTILDKSFPLKNSTLNDIGLNTLPPLIPIKSVLRLNKETTDMSEKQLNSNLLQCAVCQREFNTQDTLLRHVKTHQTPKDHMCKICGNKYSFPSTLKMHMRVHTGERPFRCHICGKGFKRSATLKEHTISHTSDRPYCCESCGKGFKLPQHLSRHKLRHSGTPLYPCKYCGKTYCQYENLAVHVRSKHTGDRPFLCSQCGKAFVSGSLLNRHIRTHTGFKPYVCELCTKAYSNFADLRKHLVGHNRGGVEQVEKKFLCVVCNVGFYHRSRLTRHMKTYRHRKQEVEGKC